MSEQGAKRPVVRSNSSLLGTIKTLVAAPLAWLGAIDNDAHDPQDSPAKRRRLHDDTTARFKRIRLHSPPANANDPPAPYLDPPHTAFPQHRTRPPAPAPAPAPAALARTMSIDPPSEHAARPSLSMPPMSARPSFRMRTSMTPQPPQRRAHRDLSEPPALTTLTSNPVFVRPPPAAPPRARSSQPAATLGALAHANRSTRSPHSSLLFGSSDNVLPPRRQIPAEKALHELDVYKTPLVPTRLRSTASLMPVPDMFKPRRSSPLVLMQSIKSPNRLGRKVSGSSKKDIVNESKPYAGEGGMKKLLARRKLEVQEYEAPPQDSPKPIPVLPEPPSQKSDWFAEASAKAPSNVSSLRVGRTKSSRTHLARPARPVKATFSAAFDDDADDAMDDGEEERLKEREILNEAAKNVPTFNIPAGFSFAQPTTNIEHDLKNAKEPPISALPFSFKPTPAPAEAEQPVVPAVTPTPPPPPAPAEPVPVPETKPATAAGSVPNFFASSSAFAKPLDIPTPPLELPEPTAPAPPQRDPSPPRPASPPKTAFGPTAPVKDAENPFWEGEDAKKKVANDKLFGDIGASAAVEKTSSTLTFGGFGSTGSSTPALSIFGAGVKKDDTSFSNSSLFGSAQPTVLEPAPALAPIAFSFGKPAAEPAPTTFDKPVSLFGAGSSSTAPSFGGESTPSFSSEPPKLANAFPFAAPVFPALSSSSDAPKLFGSSEPPKPASTNGGFAFNSASSKDKPASNPFSFGAAPSTPPPAEPKKEPMFSFAPQTTTPVASSGFLFSAGNAGSDVSKPFTFGTSNAVAQTVTPPKSQDQEYMMEESPTRDMQLNGNKPPEPRPTLGGFSFNNSGSGSIFGGTNGITSAPSPFAFGSSSPNPNPFSSLPKENKPEEPKPFGGFGQPSTSSGFTFGQSKAVDAEPPRPTTTGSFSFGSPTPTSTTGPGPSFAFGAPPVNTNPFGQPPSGSAPSSPSTFNQPSPFSFAPPPAASSNGFSFSQPASPAGGNVGLPQSGGSGFGSAGGFGQAPISPFGAQAAPAGSPSLFTIGAAPAPAPAAGGPRQIRKLPNRRGGAKR